MSLTWQQPTKQPQTWSKALTVTGPRSFKMLGLSPPEASTEVAIDWQHAYGGDIAESRPGRGDDRTDERNPVGVGLNKASGQAAPQLEVMGKPYTDGYGQSDYPPICLSALSRAWLLRRTLAGTYDDVWLKTQWPLPPLDFDNAYWNCAPADQQVEHLPAGVTVVLADVYPSRQSEGLKPWPADWRGKLPMHRLWAGLLSQITEPTKDSSDTNDAVSWQDEPMRLDTLVIDMATQKIYATYRFRMPAPDPASGTSLNEIHTVLTLGQPDQPVPIEDMGLLGD